MPGFIISLSPPSLFIFSADILFCIFYSLCLPCPQWLPLTVAAKGLLGARSTIHPQSYYSHLHSYLLLFWIDLVPGYASIFHQPFRLLLFHFHRPLFRFAFYLSVFDIHYCCPLTGAAKGWLGTRSIDHSQLYYSHFSHTPHSFTMGYWIIKLFISLPCNVNVFI